jgi:VanZ family protein
MPNFNEAIKQNRIEFRLDYLLHFLAYFAFGSLYVLWRGNRQYEIKGVEMAILIALTISFSILTEYIQLLIPGRTFNMVDILYNITGVIIGIGFTYFYIVRYFLRKRDHTPME